MATYKIGGARGLPLADRDRPWDATAAIGRVRRWAGGPDKEDINWSRYRRAFVVYDDDDSENFGAYKLPFADVIDGDLTAVPRGIIAASNVLEGARGGIDLPRAVENRCRRFLNVYRERLELEPLEMKSDQDQQNVTERRASKGPVKIETREDGSAVLTGYGAVFPKPGEPGTRFEWWRFIEEIDPHAFDRALEEKQDVVGLFNHDPSQILGRTKPGTMRLSVDKIGLLYEIDLGKTTTARDVQEHVERGDVAGSSFAFRVKREEFEELDNDKIRRRILDVDLYDTGPVTWPAYEATTTGLRSDESRRAILQRAEAALATVEDPPATSGSLLNLYRRRIVLVELEG